MITRECSVANGRCLAPAGWQIGNNVGESDHAHCRLTCFACGEPVCSECSQKMEWYHYGKQLICDTCQTDLIEGEKNHDTNDYSR